MVTRIRTLTPLVLLLALAACVLLLAAPAWAQEPAAPPPAEAPPALSEVEQLRVENHALRLRLAAVERHLAEVVNSVERERLDAMITASHPGWRMSWQSGTLERIAPEPPAETPVPSQEPEP